MTLGFQTEVGVGVGPRAVCGGRAGSARAPLARASPALAVLRDPRAPGVGAGGPAREIRRALARPRRHA